MNKPRFALMRAIALWTLSALAAPAIAVQAAGATPSVTLKVTPARAVPGATVRITGNCYPQPGTIIDLSVTDPAGHVQTFALEPQTDATTHKVKEACRDPGRYSLGGGYRNTQQPGTYAVKAGATLAGGPPGAPAIAQFTVSPFTAMVPDIQRTEQRLLGQVAAMVASARAAIAGLPGSPERSQMLGWLDALQRPTARLSGQAALLGQMLDVPRNLLARRPDAGPVLQPLLDNLTAWASSSAASATTIDAQLKQGASAPGACDRIDYAERMLQTASTQLQAVARPFDLIAIFFRHAASPGGEPGIPAWTRKTPAYDYVVQQAKADSASFAQDQQKAEAVFNTLAAQIGTATSTAVSDRLFSRYCGILSGPFTATMSAHFFTRDGKVDWWDFEEDLAGTLTLHYEHVAAGKAAPLSGEFIGHATRFGYHEDLFNSDLFGKLAKGGIVRVKDTPPSADASPGGLTSFDIPVSGKLNPGSLTFKLGDAISDFDVSLDALHAHTFYVVISPLTLMLPLSGHTQLPYMNAHFVLQHHDFTYPVAMGAKAFLIDKTDDQDRIGPGNKAHYTLHIQLCSPRCATGHGVPNAPTGSTP